MSVAFLSFLYLLSPKRRVMAKVHTTGLTDNVFVITNFLNLQERQKEMVI